MLASSILASSPGDGPRAGEPCGLGDPPTLGTFPVIAMALAICLSSSFTGGLPLAALFGSFPAAITSPALLKYSALSSLDTNFESMNFVRINLGSPRSCRANPKGVC